MSCIKWVTGVACVCASLVMPKMDIPKEKVDNVLYEKEIEVVQLDVEIPKQEVNQLNDPVYGGVTETDIINMAKMVQAEAGSQSELGKRLVIDVILNRVEASAYPNSIDGVLFSGAFSPTKDGRFYKATVEEDIVRLIEEELESRTDYNVIAFRTKHFHSFGHPYCVEGAHYFSSL